ncbi:MAG: hypothetical protein CL676_06490 [Bdellovibrionaceae bacterium]|nr:hypothetical protein [Pseudobdellovibrionaceae bacterium]
MILGIERLLQEKELQDQLLDKRLALVAHPASVTSELQHSLDALIQGTPLKVVKAFGPQHGMRGEKQDNMIESEDYVDPVHQIPVHSLYGEVRRPTPKMLDGVDVVLFDLQDVGCRIYTYLTTLIYLMEDLNALSGKELWVLDRPNPAGRPVEGQILDMKFESFVGAAEVPMRHGLTLGEMALWYKEHKGLQLPLKVVQMKNYFPMEAPDFGWPQSQLAWVNPSPNMPRLTNARQYAGSVLIEGTQLSEGRGTTIPLEVFGAPGLKVNEIEKWVRDHAGEWLKGCALKTQYFEPTFHKFKGQLCAGFQIFTDTCFYQPDAFQPYRLYGAFLKAIHQVHPEFDLWRKPPYEYEEKLVPIDILSGNEELRQWVEDARPLVGEWDERLRKDEESWKTQIQPFLLY